MAFGLSSELPTSRSLRGFTIIELLVSLALLALLATMAAPTVELVVKRQKEKELKSALLEIRQAIDAYKKAVDEGKITKKADESGYPPSLRVLYQGVIDANDPLKQKKIFILRRLPRDPFFPDTSVPPEDSWGKRSYDSEYDQPKDGQDVYDIYSLSSSQALDGTYYREW
jgi:general secretion pathway protein G